MIKYSVNISDTNGARNFETLSDRTYLHDSDIISSVESPVVYRCQLVYSRHYGLRVGWGSPCLTSHLYSITRLHVVSHWGGEDTGRPAVCREVNLSYWGEEDSGRSVGSQS